MADTPAVPLSLIVPVYNEAANFPNLVAEVERHVPPPFTLYVVYDFDADTTVPVAVDTVVEFRHLEPSKIDSMIERGLVCSGAISATTGASCARPSSRLSALEMPKAMLPLATSGITGALGPPLTISTSSPASRK